MSDKKRTVTAAAIGGVALLAIWLFSRRRNGPVEVAAPAASSDPFKEPYQQTNPGIQDGSTTGGYPAFNPQTTVNVYADSLAGISNKFIPMFGFVGVAAIGS